MKKYDYNLEEEIKRVMEIMKERRCDLIVKKGYKKKVATEIFGRAVYNAIEFINALNCNRIDSSWRRDKIFKLFADMLLRAAKNTKVEEKYVWANLRLFILHNDFGVMYVYFANGSRLKAKVEIFLKNKAVVSGKVERGAVETLEEYAVMEFVRYKRRKKREFIKELEEEVSGLLPPEDDDDDDDDIPF